MRFGPAAEYFLVLPRLADLITLPFGTFVPTALERLKPEAPSYVPWAWGLNGFFSVLSPVLSVAVSMTWGINALLLAAVLVYLVTGLALSALVARPEVTLPAGTAA
jgi:hypothetical protein